ncbi:MAG: hypothetical protein DMF50_02470 [Acidobacteria bacterium]|nr:MAG: hypothetical protein DMF50_02470 [Acidobacteriota bacterium]
MSARLRDKVEGEANRILRERVTRLRQALESALAEIGEGLEFPLAPGEWGAAEGAAQLQAVRDAVESIGRGGTQREILTALLDAAAAFYPRIALFVLRHDALAGWAGLGFLGDAGFSSEDLPRVALPAAGKHLLAQAVQRRSFAHAGQEGPGREVVSALGRVTPRESGAVPLLVRGRPVGVLYGDTGSSTERAHPLAFEIVARIAGLAMERLAAGAEMRAQPAEPLEGRASVRPRAGAGRTATPTPPEDAEMEALLGELASHPRRESGDDGLGDEERRSHADARRFAHLLVSELLLYNEESVIQGRRNRDLYERLQKEIERSRQAYQSRVPPAVASQTNYFEDELVKILAQGDSSLLRN